MREKCIWTKGEGTLRFVGACFSPYMHRKVVVQQWLSCPYCTRPIQIGEPEPQFEKGDVVRVERLDGVEPKYDYVYVARRIHDKKEVRTPKHHVSIDIEILENKNSQCEKVGSFVPNEPFWDRTENWMKVEIILDKYPDHQGVNCHFGLNERGRISSVATDGKLVTNSKETVIKTGIRLTVGELAEIFDYEH